MRSLPALLGAIWALFLLPPQLVEWDGLAAPASVWSLHESGLYDWWRYLDGAGGLDAYAWSGVLLVPAWLLIGLPLVRYRHRAGRAVALVGGVTVLGAPVCTVSYLAAETSGWWRVLWGVEAPLLLLLALTALVAAPLALRRHRVPPWWAALLGATVLVLVASTLLLGYYPHGSLVGLGLEVAALALLPTGAPTLEGEPAGRSEEVLLVSEGGLEPPRPNTGTSTSS